ncbi:5133_t:CDS:2, partial [Dentiscutata heterogama]
CSKNRETISSLIRKLKEQVKPMENHTFEPTSFNFAIQSSPFVELGVDLNLARSRSFQSNFTMELDVDLEKSQDLRRNLTIDDFNLTQGQLSNPAVDFNYGQIQRFKSNPPENDFIVTPGPSSSSNDISSDDESQENLLQLYIGLPFNT